MSNSEKPKFTPGPWEWSEHYGDNGGLYPVLESHADGHHDDVIDGEFGCIVNDADASLIKAAPDLYDALVRAHYELNAIHARDGAPQHIDWDRGRPLQTSSCSEEYFSSVVSECAAALAKAGAQT